MDVDGMERENRRRKGENDGANLRNGEEELHTFASMLTATLIEQRRCCCVCRGMWVKAQADGDELRQDQASSGTRTVEGDWRPSSRSIRRDGFAGQQ